MVRNEIRNHPQYIPNTWAHWQKLWFFFSEGKGWRGTSELHK